MEADTMLTKEFMHEIAKGNGSKYWTKEPENGVMTIRIDKIRIINGDYVKLQYISADIVVYEGLIHLPEHGGTLTLEIDNGATMTVKVGYECST